jgi:protein involved in polysaccharide export with SLBB domain
MTIMRSRKLGAVLLTIVVATGELAPLSRGAFAEDPGAFAPATPNGLNGHTHRGIPDDALPGWPAPESRARDAHGMSPGGSYAPGPALAGGHCQPAPVMVRPSPAPGASPDGLAVPSGPRVTPVGTGRGGFETEALAPPAYPAEGGVGAPRSAGVDTGEVSRIEAMFELEATQRLLGAERPWALGMVMRQPPEGSEPPGTPTPRTPAQLVAEGRLVPLPGMPSAPARFDPFAVSLRQYGYAMFASNVSTFAPVDDVPVGPDYVLGPGDDLSINVWGPVETTVVRTVDRNGRIVLPKVGDLRVWGLTFAQADRLIREQLSRYYRGFRTSMTMGRLRTVRVHVVGEVCQPGVYTLSALATLTNALFSAGGPTKLGSLRDIRLLRNHHTVGTLDLYDFLQRGDRSHDFRLESGDTIFVPTIGDVVAVAGEVKRPAIYELRGEVRVSDLIEMAGGITPRAYLKRVQIVRPQQSAERAATDVDLSRFYLQGERASNPPVNAGDLVLIYRSDPRIYNVVRVDGAVKYAGAYELKPMMRISQLLPPETLLPEAYADRVEVSRRRTDLSVEILPVNLRKAWSGDRDQDLLLKPLDEVAIRSAYRPPRTVVLQGQVVRPGTYVIADGERLSSVLERAGGFTDKAFLKGAVLTRTDRRKAEQEQLDAFVRLQEQRILATASVSVVGADKDESQWRQQALQARREMLKALASRVAVGRIVVHLDAPAALRASPNDLVLADGDVLDVPAPPSSVLVIGAVRSSTSVLYREGAGPEYYIDRVGGVTKQADRKEIHIVKADGSAASGVTPGQPIEPGDTIIVPPKEEEKVRTLPTVRDVMQTVGGALLSFAALAVLF